MFILNDSTQVPLIDFRTMRSMGLDRNFSIIGGVAQSQTIAKHCISTMNRTVGLKL